jgi:polyphosphate kinase
MNMRADFLNAPCAPDPAHAVELDLDSPERFFNRELSWLAFNWRVLSEAMNPAHPLLERVRFLSISGANLDEFYSVRVAGLRELVKEGVETSSHDGLAPAAQLARIDADARALMARQQEVWSDLVGALKAERIEVLTRKDLTKADRERLEKHFLEQVFPVVTPLALDPAHPFPFIPNEGFALALQLRRLKNDHRLEALLPVPNQVARFLRVPGGREGSIRWLPLEQLLMLFIDRIFPGYEMVGHAAFKVLRDSDLEVEEEAEDLVREFETALKRRRRGEVIRLKIAGRGPADLKAAIIEELGVQPGEIVEVDGIIGVTQLSEIVTKDRPDLLFPPYQPRMPERVKDHGGDIFAAVRQKDMLLHHPYESFSTVVQFLQQAARDPDVVAIKQTLYRTSRNSPIVNALCEAAEDGKSVTALVELKARFDEAANIRQSRQLERAGAQVVYGFIDWKTHAKASLVVRREMGSWSPTPISARATTTRSRRTSTPTSRSSPAIRRWAATPRSLFNFITGYAEPSGLERSRHVAADAEGDAAGGAGARDRPCPRRSARRRSGPR